MLVGYTPSVRVIQPPVGIKDTRQWLPHGTLHGDICRLISDAPAKRLRVRADLSEWLLPITKNDSGLKIDYHHHGFKSNITARFNDDCVHIETIDLANAQHRERFAKALKKKLPTVKLDDVETELLQFTTTRTAPDAMAPSKEMDLSRIVRPEQFYTDQVSGMAVPIVIERAENCNRSAMFIFNGKMADEFRRNIVKLVAYHASSEGRPTLP